MVTGETRELSLLGGPSVDSAIKACILFPVLGTKWARRRTSTGGWWDLTASDLETAAQAASLEFL